MLLQGPGFCLSNCFAAARLVPRAFSVAQVQHSCTLAEMLDCSRAASRAYRSRNKCFEKAHGESDCLAVCLQWFHSTRML